MNRQLIVLLLVTTSPTLGQDRLAVSDLLEVEVDGERRDVATPTSTTWTDRYVERIDCVEADGRPSRTLRQRVGGPRLDLVLLDPSAPPSTRWRIRDLDGHDVATEGLAPLETIAWLRATAGEGQLAPISVGLDDACAPSRVPASQAWPDLPPCVLEALPPLHSPVTGGRWAVTVTRPGGATLVEVVVRAELRLGRPVPGIEDPTWSPERTYAVHALRLRVRISRAKALPPR